MALLWYNIQEPASLLGRAMNKPTIVFPVNGEMYDLYVSAMAALRKSGLKDQVRELHLRSIGVTSLNHMLPLVQEFVVVRPCRPDS